MLINSNFILTQYLCIDKIFPEFEIFDHFCTDTVVPAMGLDALQNSHPVEVPLKDPSEISQVFDKITYCKGAAVLHMLHEYVGEEDFKTGIQNYIHASLNKVTFHKYLTAMSCLALIFSIFLMATLPPRTFGST